MTLIHRESSRYFGQQESRTRIGPFELWRVDDDGDWSVSFSLGPFRQPGIALFFTVSRGYTDGEFCCCQKCVAKRDAEEGEA